MLESKFKEGFVWGSGLVYICVTKGSYVHRACAMQALRAPYCCQYVVFKGPSM